MVYIIENDPIFYGVLNNVTIQFILFEPDYLRLITLINNSIIMLLQFLVSTDIFFGNLRCYGVYVLFSD